MKRHILLFALLASVSSFSLAEPSVYLSVGGGPLFPTISKLGGSEDGATLESDMEASTGYAGFLAVGYGDTLGFRGELELGYRKADLRYMKGIRFSEPEFGTFVLPLALPVSGKLSTLSLMMNGLYVLQAGKALPYVGAGVGIARHSATLKASGTEDDSVSVEDVDSDDTVLAYQGMIGLIIPVEDNMDARLGYRYFNTADSNLDDVDMQYGGGHSIDVGLAMRF